MESRSTVAQTTAFSLPVAQMRRVFAPDDVERRLAKLHSDEHDSLRATYRRMLERGPQRFQVKPSGVPDMGSLYQSLPNFTEVLDDVKRHVALAQDSSDGMEVTPMLLLGQPGKPPGRFRPLTQPWAYRLAHSAAVRSWPSRSSRSSLFFLSGFAILFPLLQLRRTDRLHARPPLIL